LSSQHSKEFKELGNLFLELGGGNMWWVILPVALIGYLIGSIPIGYLIVRLIKGEDIRRHGSGRTGGTNALRAGGPVAGILTAVGDALKGYAAVALARIIVGPAALATSLGTVAAVLAGLGAVIGHNWSLYLGFKGGAGTAPNIGAAIAFWPIAGLYLAPMVPLGLYLIGYASVTSLVIAGMVLATFIVRAALQADPNWWYVAYAIAAAAAVVWALRPNIRRLREGTERMVGLRARVARRRSGDDNETGAAL
jgi:acyl phosphate:glycerol-3-phosphate acyltransferase